MPDRLWSFEQLARFTRYEDAEVRYWAAERLVHLYPERAATATADLLFDDHDSTPTLVASHLGQQGDESHVPALTRGYRRGSGELSGHCLAALAKLGAPAAPKLAREALHRRDLTEGSLALIVAGLAEMASDREPRIAAGKAHREEASDAAMEILLRRQELYADPAALAGCLKIFGDDHLGDLAGKWITALHFRGIDAADACLHVIGENLQLEDVSWCLRTGRGGRVDLERSLRAMENGYDREVRSMIPAEDRAALAAAFGRGEFREMAVALASLIESRARSGQRSDPDDTLLARLAAFASGFRREEVLNEAERLGHPMHTWIISLLLSALIKTAGYRNFEREAERARGRLDALLELAELESSALSRRLPGMLAEAGAAGGDDARRQIDQWCASILEARGPFFPKVVAIETIGELALTGHLPNVVAHLADDNGFIYAAAERALAKMGDDGVEAARAEIAEHRAHLDAMHSILVVMSDLMTERSLQLVLDHFEELMEASGPEEGPELVSLFGARELIPHLRRWLKRVEEGSSQVGLRARVGHALLLAGAIHNVPIPEEERILQAIDEYWKEVPEEADADSKATGPYLM